MEDERREAGAGVPDLKGKELQLQVDEALDCNDTSTGVAKAILAALSVDKIIYYVEHAETIYANVFNFKFHSNILYLLYMRRPFWSSWHYLSLIW